MIPYKMSPVASARDTSYQEVQHLIKVLLGIYLDTVTVYENQFVVCDYKAAIQLVPDCQKDPDS